MSRAAKSARESKDRNPSYYCPVPRCLWRTYDARTGTYKPCAKHGGNEGK
jgi:hypothetical protein